MSPAIDNVVLLAIITNGFWLTIFFVAIVCFRFEIRALLSSLSSVSIAGNHFELGDKNLTIKSFSTLSNIFLDLLCDSNNTEKLAEVFSEVNAQQLSKFTRKYLIEAPKEEINFALIRNIAWIAGQRGSLGRGTSSGDTYRNLRRWYAGAYCKSGREKPDKIGLRYVSPEFVPGIPDGCKTSSSIRS